MLLNKLNPFYTLLTFILPFTCFSQDSLLFKTIKENSYTLEIVNDAIIGTALPIIQKEIEESQFLMIGEQHGIREVAEFTTAVNNMSFNEGFEYLCIETDPYVAEKLELLATSELKDMELFVEKFPLVIPFYDSKEEFELIRSFKNGKSDSNESIWGVDQMFMASSRFALSILENEARSNKIKSFISEYTETVKNQFNSFLNSQNPQELPMIQLTDADFEKLSNSFNENSKAYQLICDLQTSQKIYMHFLKGEYYLNNFNRTKLMKRQFMDYYNRNSKQGTLPKVIFKFGANHMSKGISPVYCYDLGNMVSELAEINGSTAANFKITALKGESLGFGGSISKFDYTDELIPEIKMLYEEKVGKEKWIFINLKSLRPLLSRDLLEKHRDLIFSYDYWIIIPEATPLTGF